MSYLYIETNYPVSVMFEKILSWWTVPSGGLRLYFGLYNNDVNGWQYFSGNATHGLTTGSKLVNRGTSEATAQSTYLDAEQFLDADNRLVVILPAIFVAKKVRLYIESGHSIILREWIMGERFNAGELVTGNISMTDQYSSPPKITVTASENEYLKVGKLNATEFGIKGFDSTGQRVLEISSEDIAIDGAWDFPGKLVASDLELSGSTNKVTAGQGNYVSVLDGSHTTYRMYVGNASPTAAAFRVDVNGKVHIDDGVFVGSIPDLADNYVTATMLVASSVGSTELAGQSVKTAHLAIEDFDFGATVSVAGNVIVNGVLDIDHLYLSPNETIRFGNASQTTIYRNATSLFIDNTVGDLSIRTGVALATALTIDINQNAKVFGDLEVGDVLTIGNTAISSNVIQNATNFTIQTPTSGGGSISITPREKNAVEAVVNSHVKLYHNANLKANTATDGFKVYGKLNVTGSILGEIEAYTPLPNSIGNTEIKNASAFEFTNTIYAEYDDPTNAIAISHDFDSGYIVNATGALIIETTNGNMIFNTAVASIATPLGHSIKFYTASTLAVTINATQVTVFENLIVGPATLPTEPYQMANKKYVDNVASGLGDDLSASVHDNTSRIEYLEASVANNTTAINAVDEYTWAASVHDNSLRLTNVEASVADHTGRIVNLEASVAANTSAINNLEASTFELSADSVNATHIQAGALTSADLRDEDFRFTQDIIVTSNASISGNIAVGGTVDGIDLQSMQATLYNVSASVVDHTGRIVYLEASVAGLTTAVNAIDESSWQASVHDNTARIVYLEASVADLTTAVNAIDNTAWQASVHDNSLRLTNVEASVSDHTGRIVYLEASVADHTTAINAIDQGSWQASVHDNTDRIENLEATVTDNTARIVFLEASVTDHEQRITVNEGAISTAQTDITNLEASVANHTTRIVDVEAYSASIADHTNRIVYLEASVANLVTAVNTIDEYTWAASVHDNTDRIEYLEASVTDHTTRIVYLEASVADHTTAINGLSSLSNWGEDGTTFLPNVAGYDIGSATYEIGNMYLGDDAYIYFGSDQDAHIYNNGVSWYLLTKSTADVEHLTLSNQSTHASSSTNFKSKGGGGIVFTAENAGGYIYFKTGAAPVNALVINNTLDADFYGSLGLRDDEYFYLGNGDDCQIRWDATNSEFEIHTRVSSAVEHLILANQSVHADATLSIINKGLSGMLIDQNSATGSIYFRTGSTPTTAIEIDENQIVTAANHIVGPASTPQTDYQLSNKKYVDDNAGGVDSSASVANLNTRVVYLEASVSDLTIAVNAVDEYTWAASVNDNSLRLTNVEASVVDHTGRIVYLEASVANHTTAINSIDESTWTASLHAHDIATTGIHGAAANTLLHSGSTIDGGSF